MIWKVFVMSTKKINSLKLISDFFSLKMSDIFGKIIADPIETERNPDDVMRSFIISSGYFGPYFNSIIKWALSSNEFSNFTYDLTPLNLRYLSAFVSMTTGKSRQEINKYIEEIRNDQELSDHIKGLIEISASETADSTPLYGRRIGWYAIIRALKPRLVLETGLDKGMGSCVVAAALLRNRNEGFAGNYIGVDIVEGAGWLFQLPYNQVGRIIYSDSIAAIKEMQEPIDLFISDSDHNPEYELKEYYAIAPLLSDKAFIIGDNSHGSSALIDFAEATDRNFLFFQEKPDNHWYQGAGIGLAFPKAN